jgi:hypothetical protein
MRTLDFDAAYQSLPAFESPDGSPTGQAGPAPADASPAASPSATPPLPDDVDDGSLDLGEPELDGDGEDDGVAGNAAGSESEDGEEPEDDRDWLIERAQKADEYERWMAAQQSQARENEAVAYWDSRLQQANEHFAAREAVIYQNAENNLNPVAYLRQEMSNLTNEANAWYAQYRDNREQALWQFAHQQAIPHHAARVVEHYKLPKESVNELLDYPPEQMEREAQKMRQRLIRERKALRTIDQLKRKEAARKIAATTTSPGSGRAGGGKGGSAPSFEEGYFSIPWTRG